MSFFINRQGVNKECFQKNMWHFSRSLFFYICPCSPIFNYPIGERQSRIPRQSHFQEAGEAWMWAHGSRRVTADEKEAGIWLCWISPRCAVCQVRGVTDGREKGRRGGVKDGEKWGGGGGWWAAIQPCSLRSVSFRGEMRLADGSV